MLRYLLAHNWWPLVNQQEYQFLTGETRVNNNCCHANCSFRPRRAQGDSEKPFYLIDESADPTESALQWIWRRTVRLFGREYS